MALKRLVPALIAGCLLGFPGPMPPAVAAPNAPPAPAEASAPHPTVEVPVTIQDLLDASHPLSVQEELAAAQAAAGTVPVDATRPYELTSSAELGLG